MFIKLFFLTLGAISLIVIAVRAQKLSHSECESRIKAAGVNIYSSRGCYGRTRGCTSLEQIRETTCNCVVTLKRASGCPTMTITGGTETGHSSSAQSHYNGYKVDLRLDDCLNNYIKRTFVQIGKRGDGATQYKSGSGNIYALEGNHWDITFNQC